MEYKRILSFDDAGDDSLFLWGARQVGKSTLVKTVFPEAIVYDLLKSDEFERLARRPSLLREELDKKGPETPRRGPLADGEPGNPLHPLWI